jgi:cardiolipin synthase
MWNYIVRGTEDYTRFRAELPESSENGSSMQSVPSEHGGSLQSNLPGSRGYVQPYADSPLFPEHIGENVYLNMINMAHRYVYIYTPYLIIDSEMSTALCNAAKSGVDVRIITPGIPDKKTVFLLTRSHYPELLKNGVKIYQYTPGFVHAKCFVCDDKYATVGSINLDYRSLCLHFECGALFYQSRVVAEVQEDILQTLSACEEITIEQCENLRLPTRLVRGVLRLFAPLL